MDHVLARKMWRTLEPYHGLVYFAPEATEAHEARGVRGRDGYFASRAAAMGAVPADVVIATFFNFNPFGGGLTGCAAVLAGLGRRGLGGVGAGT